MVHLLAYGRSTLWGAGIYLSLAVVPALADTPRPVVYQCPPNQVLTAVFQGVSNSAPGEPAKVQLTLPDQRLLTLPQAPSASGTQYSDGTFTFWFKGNTALLEQGDRVLLQDCVTFPNPLP